METNGLSLVPLAGWGRGITELSGRESKEAHPESRGNSTGQVRHHKTRGLLEGNDLPNCKGVASFIRDTQSEQMIRTRGQFLFY